MEVVSAGSRESNSLNAAVVRKKEDLQELRDANIADQVKKEEQAREVEKDLDQSVLRDEAARQSQTTDAALGKNLDITS